MSSGRRAHPYPYHRARAQEQAQQLADLRRQIDAQIAELAEARPRLVEYARLSGELAALRQHLTDQATLIERLSSRPWHPYVKGRPHRWKRPFTYPFTKLQRQHLGQAKYDEHESQNNGQGALTDSELERPPSE